MRSLFPDEPIRAQAANLAFDRSFSAAIDRFGVAPLPGAADALTKLAADGTKICLLTCFSRPASSLLQERLPWCHQADLLLCADDVPRGYPWPDAFLTAVLRLGSGDVRSMAVVSATESGVLAARRAGAGTVIGVHSGAHAASRLRRAGATALLPDLTGLFDLLAASPPRAR
jgi:phosphoglycolate phosphatase